MKTMVRFLLLLIAIPLFTQCHDKIIQEQTLYEPVYLSFDDLRKPIQASSPDSLQKPGKIYVKDQLIFINEYLKGIHVVDNSDPAHPVPLAFIDIPGNVDMAVRNDILYADSYVDLVALDISDPEHIVEKGRARDILPYITPPTDGDYPVDYENLDRTKGVIVRWEARKVRKEIHLVPYPLLIFYNYDKVKEFTEGGVPYVMNGGEGGVSMSSGGSMARFTLYDKWLYVLTGNNILKIIKVDDPAEMYKENELLLRGSCETIFQHEGKLFFGTRNGMSIYDLQDPLIPVFISIITHIQSCDPVVVQGDYAYVTLYAGNGCGSSVNRLDVINISDLYHPVLKRSYNFGNPHGLAVADTVLFVCDGQHGLKVMDARDPLNMHVTATYPGVHAYDVIPLPASLLMIGEDGLFQYRITSLSQLQLLSTIRVKE